jgi:lipoprotein-anchoring transpeptidase ErfK/SrfK
MDRRTFMTLAAACTLLPGARKAAASSEHPVPVKAPQPLDRFRAAIDDYSVVKTQFLPQTVTYDTEEYPGTVIIDTDERYLYLVTGPNQAKRYGVGVGRAGFAWAGTATIQRKTKWPTWYPPPEMRARDREARRWRYGMPGGPRNPLGARALYLYRGNRDTLYRIHGTREPKSIGKAVSSGCIRMLNADVSELFERLPIGTKVVVLASRATLAQKRPKTPQRKTLASAFRRRRKEIQTAFNWRRERRRRRRYVFDWFLFQ